MNARAAQVALVIVLAIAVLAIGVGTITEYALRVQTALNQLFVHTHVGPHPGRPSPPTAVAVTLLSAAILFFDYRPTARLRLSEWLVMAAGLIAFTALLGQLFGAVALYRFVRTPVIGASPATVVSLLMISAGLLLERPDTGIMRVATGRGPGNVLLLRLVPPAILAPILVALISARLLERPGIADVAFVFVLLTVVICLGNLFLLSATAIHLNKTHDEIIQAQARARALFEQASDGILIADLDGRYIDANDAIGHMLGYSRESARKCDQVQ
jgi:PAS domain-containing protein